METIAYALWAIVVAISWFLVCLLYTSDAADERSSLDLGGRRIFKKKTTTTTVRRHVLIKKV